MVKLNLPVLAKIGGISANFESLVRNIKPLFMHSPADFVNPVMDPKGGRNGSCLNSRIKSKIDLVIPEAIKFAKRTPIRRVYRLIDCPIISINIIAGAKVFVAPPSIDTDPTTANTPSY